MPRRWTSTTRCSARPSCCRPTAPSSARSPSGADATWACRARISALRSPRRSRIAFETEPEAVWPLLDAGPAPILIRITHRAKDEEEGQLILARTSVTFGPRTLLWQAPGWGTNNLEIAPMSRGAVALLLGSLGAGLALLAKLIALVGWDGAGRVLLGGSARVALSLLPTPWRPMSVGMESDKADEDAATILDRIAAGAMETQPPSSTAARDRFRGTLEAALPAVRVLI